MNQGNGIAKEINLKHLYNVIIKRFWIVLVITFLTTIAGWYYSSLHKTEPLYEASTNIFIEADSEYRKTLQVIIKDPSVLESVIADLGLEKSPAELAGQINAYSIDDTQVVRISVTDTSSKRAVEIANTTAKVFSEKIPLILKFKEDKEDIRILSGAKENPLPINNSNPNKIILAAIVFGVVLGIGLLFLIDSLDDTIKSESDIEMILGIQVLGSVSSMNKKNISKKKHKRIETGLRGETIVSK
ncbi:capsular biosynthesis protein [Bacillus sp. FJAT-49732]|uniref:Capsular biosynthesis protein n=1 Tax=Lederbergia citrisecunda TaxID=2833583 RepID=A0A942YIJ6_9BACI|nr:Wzz/FepE/Etk N-terminal domain-containing protein [Lederbergia citrisecunda]MBS4198393.1 capsular biosynthesis protein [Lederbergia citrisecunda]